MDIKKQRVLITRPDHQSEQFVQKLKSLEAQPITFPVIKISASTDTEALDRALSLLHTYDWLVLTSVNAVDAVWSRLQALEIKELPVSLRVAAVGPQTAGALRAHHVIPDFVPDQFIGEAILPGLGCLQDRLILLPTADIARETLPDAISAADGIAHVIAAYRTIPATTDPEGLAALRQGVDLITFTSPSTVRNFVALTQSADLDPYSLPGKPLFAYIGPITASAAKELNLPVDITATEYTVDGLIQAVLDHQPLSTISPPIEPTIQ